MKVLKSPGKSMGSPGEVLGKSGTKGGICKGPHIIPDGVVKWFFDLS